MKDLKYVNYMAVQSIHGNGITKVSHGVFKLNFSNNYTVFESEVARSSYIND